MGLGLSGLRLGLGQRGGGSRGPTITTAPVISGDPSVEANVLTLTTAPVWDGAVSSSYVWQLNNGGWADIALSTDSTTVTVQAGEHIYDYRVLATATNTDGTSTTTSNVLEGLDAPVLSNFTDNLDQDPPNALFDSTEAGTLTWDFDASATPPAKGAGSIGTGTDSVTAGANNINIDLSAYPGETGYLHLRVSNAAGDSNVLTSQQITTPAALVNLVTNGGFDTDTDWTKTNATISGGVASLDVQNNSNIYQAITLANGAPHEVVFTVSGLSTGSVLAYLGTFSSSDIDNAIAATANGVFSRVLWAGTSDFLRLSSINATAGTTLDDVQVYALPASLVTNGLFDADTDWTKTGSATISSDRASLLNVSSIEQTGLGITPGATYRVSGNIAPSGNTVKIRLGGNAATGAHVHNVTGYTDVELVAGSDGDFLVIEVTTNTGFAALIYNIYVGVA